ncbi:hypothetical protein THAOC_23997 [Thalassiosira oceanica]|uniref:Uncharacterized protein n=1 Tax=Thalassiosira oceanica TaxID=159749 RepID=K0RUS8_THAOC|nr:hypothetical protein THAOC_23997 [Thalassiosira oceanica]|eukprot:EJK56169.1 hypothetical protein THAOC_23997 [Thalassiosira oceanica]
MSLEDLRRAGARSTGDLRAAAFAASHGPSLDPPRSSGDTGPFLVGSTVEDEGPPVICLASTAGGGAQQRPHPP